MPQHDDELKRMEDRAWLSFAFHADQRLKTFNFYIVLASLLVNAMATTLQKDFRIPYLGAAVGLLLAVLSFVFWKIDVRNKQLIKLAEDVLRHFESVVPSVDGNAHRGAYFTRELTETAAVKAKSGAWHFSYAKAFVWIFSLFAAVGLVGAALAICAPR